MGDPRLLPGFVLVGLTAALVLLVLLVVGLTRPGPRRAGLVAGALPLALLPPAVAAAFGSLRFAIVFSDAAARGDSSAALEALGALWAVQRAGWGASFCLCAAGLLIGLARLRGAPDATVCSTRRGLALLLLPALALTAAWAASRPIAGATRVAAAVVSATPNDVKAQARMESVLEDEGLPARGSAAIGAASRYLAGTVVYGTCGGLTGALVLIGLALPGYLLSSRCCFGAAFTALASLAWLVAGTVSALVAAGVLSYPLRLSSA